MSDKRYSNALRLKCFLTASYKNKKKKLYNIMGILQNLKHDLKNSDKIQKFFIFTHV